MNDSLHKPNDNQNFALLNLGFRPFFILAGVFGVLGMAYWGLVVHGVMGVDPGPLTLYQWHAHEMIFGYALAVIGGFLLTSVKTWTGLQTPSGAGLLVLAVLWLAARLAFALGGAGILVGALLNLAFVGAFAAIIGDRVLRVKQWRQLGILGVVGLLALGEFVLIFGIIQRDQWLIGKVLYLALYLVLLMILIMARRVVPAFTERGVGYPCTLGQSKILDALALWGFVLYALTSVFLTSPVTTALIAGATFIAHSLRLWNWYTPGIWKRPLLWSLHLSLAAIAASLLLAALAPWLKISSYLVLHGFAVGGLGLITLSMMSRVALGHTGRDIHNPPGLVSLALVLMVAAALIRVLFPLLLPGSISLWLALSQLAWIAAFAIFLGIYTGILVKPRVDGAPG